MDAKFEKLQEILSNEEEGKRLLGLAPEEASRVLKEEYQLVFSVEELTDIVQGIKDYAAETNGGELSESDLSQVAGGGKGSESYQFGRSVGRATPVIVALVCVGVLCGW